jgi:tetratricopeptide (TPR) repeat protein
MFFWMAAALLTADSWGLASTPGDAPGAARSGKRWRAAALVAAALVTVLVGWVSTRWLLSSMAYAHGVRLGIAGQMVQAYGEFRRSLALTPWLPLPAESAAYTGLRLATAEREPLRRSALLHEAEAIVQHARDHAIGGPGSWALSGQIAFAEARNGEPSQLSTSRDAFAMALRLRPGDPRLLAQSAWVWLESGDVQEARRLAEQALAREPNEWMAWAVLTRVLKAQGDTAGAVQATGRARGLAPPEALPLLDALLR